MTCQYLDIHLLYFVDKISNKRRLGRATIAGTDEQTFLRLTYHRRVRAMIAG